MSKQYSFVIDGEGEQLSPTSKNKAWVLVRKGKAKLVSRFPLTVQLNKVIPKQEIDNSKTVLGIDDGSKYVGFAVVQQCENKNKVLFKGTMQQRQNVSKKMKERKGYRKNRRYNKRYRPVRFNNRSSSKRRGRIPPTIKQKKQAILRVVNRLTKYINIDEIILEDVAIDIRKIMEEGEVNDYQKSNRLDENLRKATLYRDNFTCQMCKATDTMLEAHHIRPKRLGGADSIYNLITLCSNCHKKVTGGEMSYSNKFYKVIKGKDINFKPAMHVMQGKTWLRDKLSDIAPLTITNGGDTANKRIKHKIEKSHTNDAICITNLLPVNNINIEEYVIKPLRKKNKSKIKGLKGFKVRDLVKYTKRDGTEYIGYITSLRVKNDKYKTKVCNFTEFSGETYRGYGFRNLKLLDRPEGLIFSVVGLS